MRKLLQLMIALVPLAFISAAQAVPTAYYDRPTGNIYLQNDTHSRLTVVSLSSSSGRLGGTPNDIAQLHEDFSDLPRSITYIDVLPTTDAHPPHLSQLYNLGKLILDGGPAGDLRLQYWPILDLSYDGQIIEIPEPSTFVLAGVGAGMLHFVHRKTTCRERLLAETL